MKILVVEDCNWKYEDIKNNLDAISDFEIIRVETRNEAIREIYNNHFDVIILDMQFPSMVGGEMLRDGGLQVLKRMHHRGFNIPVIVCSSSGCGIPEEYKNVIGYILYGGMGNLGSLLKHYIESITGETANDNNWI